MKAHDTLAFTQTKIPESFAGIARTQALAVFGPDSRFDAEIQAIRVEGQTIPLTHLYNHLRSTNETRWPEAINRRFTDVAIAANLLAPATDSWVCAEPNLHVCIRHRGPTSQLSKPVTQNLCQALVLDVGDFCVHVSSKHLQSWGVTSCAAWNTGLKNNSGRLSVKHQQLADNLADFQLLTGDLCTSGVVTDIKQHVPDSQLPERFLLALPTFETVVLIPTSDQDTSPAARRVQNLLPVWTANAVHPLSTELFELDDSGDLRLAHTTN